MIALRIEISTDGTLSYFCESKLFQELIKINQAKALELGNNLTYQDVLEEILSNLSD